MATIAAKGIRQFSLFQKQQGLGKEKYPYPQGAGYIECDELKCVGLWRMPDGVLDDAFPGNQQNLAESRSENTPAAAQGIQTTSCSVSRRASAKGLARSIPQPSFSTRKRCIWCSTPERCLGEKCLLCKEACSSDAIRMYAETSPHLLSAICATSKTRVCGPLSALTSALRALYFKTSAGRSAIRLEFLRKHPDEKPT